MSRAEHGRGGGFDTVVIGLGGAGSAALYHLARNGFRVLGLEQYGPNHARGSSHGRSRIYRTAYFEGTAYVPYVRRAQRLWRALEAESGLPILRETGALMIGRPESRPIEGALRSARRYRLAHQLLRAREVRDRFPQFRVEDPEVAVWERDAGVLFPENCNAAHLLGAVAAGATAHYQEPVRSWSAGPRGVTVRTARGNYRADRLVLAAGPWTARLGGGLYLPLEVERQVVFWFRSRSREGLHRPERMPVFVWATTGDRFAYGTPDFGNGVKIASEAGRVVARPEDSHRALRPGEAAPVRRYAKRHFVGLAAREHDHAACLFTNAPDHHFLLGPHPDHPNVTLVSACSGHGFKFASAVGETVAELARGRPLPGPLRMFDPARFARSERLPPGRRSSDRT